jgi:hypothetical protein
MAFFWGEKTCCYTKSPMQVLSGFPGLPAHEQGFEGEEYAPVIQTIPPAELLAVMCVSLE